MKTKVHNVHIPLSTHTHHLMWALSPPVLTIKLDISHLHREGLSPLDCATTLKRCVALARGLSGTNRWRVPLREHQLIPTPRGAGTVAIDDVATRPVIGWQPHSSDLIGRIRSVGWTYQRASDPSTAVGYEKLKKKRTARPPPSQWQLAHLKCRFLGLSCRIQDRQPKLVYGLLCSCGRLEKHPKERGCWSPREDNEEAARFVGVPHCSSPVLVSL